MKSFLLAFTVTAAFVLAGISPRLIQSANQPASRAPVLVELFTSEGCSSCPPADRFLQKLDQQPKPGAELIVLSEHVDYWNHIGWKDPYSSNAFSQRQNAYAKRFGLESVYTPQMVVDGSSEVVGGDSLKAEQLLQSAAGMPKMPVQLSSVSLEPPHTLHAHIETGQLDNFYNIPGAEVYIVVALDHAQSQVSGGENAGRQLTHVAVVRSILKVGDVKPSQSLIKDVAVKLDSSDDHRDLRLVAFVQEPHQGRVLGATRVAVNPKPN